jgi:hypothetical protein
VREVSSFEPLRGEFENMNKAIGKSQKNPVTGLTQGGSSDKYAGCKSAAKDVNVYRNVPVKQTNEETTND